MNDFSKKQVVLNLTSDEYDNLLFALKFAKTEYFLRDKMALFYSVCDLIEKFN